MFLNGFEISIIIKTQKKKSFFKSKFDSEMEHQLLRHETQVGIPHFMREVNKPWKKVFLGNSDGSTFLMQLTKQD